MFRNSKTRVLLNRIKSRITGDSFTESLLSLTIINVLNKVFPFISLPIVYSTLGVEKWGIVAVVLSIISYGEVLVNFGFDRYVVQQFVLLRDDAQESRKFYNHIISIRLFLSAVAMILLMLLILIVPSFRNYAECLLYIGMYFIGFSFSFFPIFQGFEKFRYITIIHFIAKLFELLIILTFLKVGDDYKVYMQIYALVSLVVGFLSLILARRELGLLFNICMVDFIHLKNSGHLFISKLFSNLYGPTNILLLGAFCSPAEVGRFSIGVRVIQSITMIVSSISTAYHPKLINAYKKSWNQFLGCLVKNFKMISIVGVITFAGLSVFNNEVLEYFAGAAASDVVVIYDILVLQVLFIPFGAFFTNAFVTLNQYSLVSKVVAITGVINILAALVVIPVFHATGLAWVGLSVKVLHIALFTFAFSRVYKDKANQ